MKSGLGVIEQKSGSSQKKRCIFYLDPSIIHEFMLMPGSSLHLQSSTSNNCCFSKERLALGPKGAPTPAGPTKYIPRRMAYYFRHTWIDWMQMM